MVYESEYDKLKAVVTDALMPMPLGAALPARDVILEAVEEYTASCVGDAQLEQAEIDEMN